ncbi:MAG: fibronectin type III-like domain-contianing protein, partial [Anaerolineales bacterium]
YGLSYTSFVYRNLELGAAEFEAGQEIKVRVEVENTGARAGKEVVQVYIRDPQASVIRPEKELKAFAKISLEPGEKQTVSFSLDDSALAFYDPVGKRWAPEPGMFEVLVGGSSRDLRLKNRFAWRLRHAPAIRNKARLSVGLPIQKLLEDEGARSLVERHFYDLVHHPYRSVFMTMTLEQFARLFPDPSVPGKLKEIEDALAAM